MPQSDLDNYARQVEAQRRQDTRPLILSILRSNHVPIDEHQPLSEQLTAWLAAKFPLPEHEVVVKAEKGKITFSVEAFADGLYALGNLHKALRPIDPLLLPSLFRTLEHLSAALCPTFGPAGMEQFAEYIWSLDRLADFELPERLERDVGQITERAALTLARRLAIPHEKLIRDETPQVYFSVDDTVEETVDRLLKSVRAWPHHPVMAALSPLIELLPQLQRLSGAVPEMDDLESEEITFLPPIGSVLTPAAKTYCSVAECADEFMRAHWEGGEHAPHYVLNMDGKTASQRRVFTLLRLIPKFMACHTEILKVISIANDPS